MLNLQKTIEKSSIKLKKIPSIWDARKCILEMKKNDCKNWKQMEWIGFYFQYYCEKKFRDFMKIPGPKYGNVSFDGLSEIPWDFKAHAINTSSHELIVNDRGYFDEA